MSSGADAPARTANRLATPDIVRAVALAGVIALNYHGYLNGAAARAAPGDGWAQRLFDPWDGVLATRFAATFVVVAGVGVTLLTAAARRVDDPVGRDRAIAEMRWRLVRRGTLLVIVGGLLDWVWDGTILPYYGAMFVVAATLFQARTTSLIAIGATTALAAAALRWWIVARTADGREPRWLLEPDTLDTRSPRGAVFDLVVNGTHPLLPWFAFLVGGMVLGRALPRWHRRAAAAGIAALALAITLATYAMSSAFDDTGSRPLREAVLSTRPGDRALLYTVGTFASSVAALALVHFLVLGRAMPRTGAPLATLGRFALSAYLAHVAVYLLVVEQFGIVRATGLDTVLTMAGAVWVAVLVAAVWWEPRLGRGPAEWVYRRFGG